MSCARKGIARPSVYEHLSDVELLRLYAGESALGQEFVREAVRLTPSICHGTPCELVSFLVDNIANESSLDLEETLTQSFAQLPAELSPLAMQLPWAIGRGTHSVGYRQWSGIDRQKGKHTWHGATAVGAQLDEPLLQSLAYQLFLLEGSAG